MKTAGFDILFSLLRMMARPTTFPSSWMPVGIVYLSSCQRGKVLGVFSLRKGSLQLLISSHQRERDKMLLRAILCDGVLERIPS